MKRALVLLAALAAVVLLAAPAFCVIQEVVGEDGRLKYYKYSDRKGGIVFTNSRAQIPADILAGNEIEHVGPPLKAEPPEGGQAVGHAGEGAAPGTPSLDDALKPVAPAAAPPPQESGGNSWLLAVLGVVVLAGAGAVAYKMFGARKDETPQTAAAPAYRGRERPQGARTAPARRAETPADIETPAVSPHGAERLAEAHSQPSGAAAPQRDQPPREAIERLIQAGDYAGAAQICDAQGEIARGADLYVKAGLYAEAAANYGQVGDFARAGECHLKAGEPDKAAASFEQAGDPARGYAAMSGYWYDQGDARQAAAWAEKAGDFVQAATYFQEVGELARAGDLFFRGGFHSEAAEIFVLLGDLPRAAEAFAKAGRALEAAQALEKSGGDARRIAELYEQGGGFYPAGRLFVKVGDLDRALAALQQLDGDAPEYPQASLLVGMIFLKRGMTKLAQEKFVKLIAERPIQRATLEPYYFLALCHERDGEAQKARAIFEKILAEDYGFRDVKARLAAR